MNYTGENYTVNGKEVEVFKVNHDINGNPRYVIHFLSVLTEAEKVQEPGKYDIFVLVNRAIDKIRRIGGSKYRAKWFGGGLVFQSYNVKEDLARIL